MVFISFFMVFICFICFEVDIPDIFKFYACYLVINIILVDQNSTLSSSVNIINGFT